MSLGELKLAAKLQHQPWDCGDQSTSSAAMSIALPHRHASKSQSLYENPTSSSLPKTGVPMQVSAKEKGESQPSVTSFFSLGRLGDPLCRGGSSPQADVKGSQHTQESNPGTQQIQKASPLH